MDGPDLSASLLQKAKYSELSHFHIQSDFQTVSKVETIKKLSKRLREDSDTKDGKISESAFVRIVSSLFKLKNNDLPQMLFKRILSLGFATRYYRNKGQEELISERIDLHDIILALTLLSRIDEDKKLLREPYTVIFELTDMDEDGCLTPEEIGKMFEVIEKIFAKERADLHIQSRVLLEQLSRVKARRCYEWAMVAGNLEAKIQKDEGLITFLEFSETLNQMPKLRQQLLPHYRDLRTVLTDIPSEKVYQVSDYYRDDFVMFRYELHTIFAAGMRKKKTELDGLKRAGEAVVAERRIRPGVRSEARDRPDDSSKVRQAADSGKLHEMKLPRAADLEKQLLKPSKNPLNPKSKAKDTDKGPKECPGIIRTDDSARESRLPPGVWDLNPNAMDLYTRDKEGPEELDRVTVKAVNREVARILAVPKRKTDLILEEMEQSKKDEMQGGNKEETVYISINGIAKKVSDKLGSIPKYPTKTWDKEYPPERHR